MSAKKARLTVTVDRRSFGRAMRPLPRDEQRALDETLGRRAGELLGRTRTSDVVDAALVVLAEDDDRIVTSDTEDLERLVAASGRRIELVRA